MANWGYGLLGFTRGVSDGLALGGKIKGVRDQRKIDKVREEGLSAAKQKREQAVESNVQPLLAPGEAGLAPQQYAAGDKTFENKDKARAEAGKGVGSVMDFFMKDAVPKIQEAYLEQGKVEQAQAWGTWADGQRGKQAIKDWAKGYTALQSGDWDDGIKNFGNYYNKYIDDGVEFRNHELVKDKDGNTLGAKVELYDKETGKSRSMVLDQEKIIGLGMASNPQALFEQEQEQMLAANKARVEDAQDTRKFNREQLGKERLVRLKETLEAKYGTGMGALAGMYRKGMAPADMIFQAKKLLEENYKTQRLSEEEKHQIAVEATRKIYAAADEIHSGGPQAGLPVIIDNNTGLPVDTK